MRQMGVRGVLVYCRCGHHVAVAAIMLLWATTFGLTM
jgi:hypothetical protein